MSAKSDAKMGAVAERLLPGAAIQQIIEVEFNPDCSFTARLQLADGTLATIGFSVGYPISMRVAQLAPMASTQHASILSSDES